MKHTHSEEQALFGRAFEDHSDALFRHCSFRISDRDRALELTQETFLRAWTYVHGGGEIQDVKAFLYRTLNNLIIDEYRKKKPTSLDAILEGEGVSEGDFPSLTVSGKEEIESVFDGERARTLLETLPDKYRTAVSLRYVDGLSPKEIAEVTGETENVISVRIHRGIERLRKEWEHTAS